MTFPVCRVNAVYSISRQSTRQGLGITKKRRAEFAALRLVDGQRIGQLQGRGTFLSVEFPWFVLVDKPRLRGQFNFNLHRFPVFLLRAPMPGYHPYIAVGNITVVFVRVDTAASAIDDIDHFVAVDDAFWPGRDS